MHDLHRRPGRRSFERNRPGIGLLNASSRVLTSLLRITAPWATQIRRIQERAWTDRPFAARTDCSGRSPSGAAPGSDLCGFVRLERHQNTVVRRYRPSRGHPVDDDSLTQLYKTQSGVVDHHGTSSIAGGAPRPRDRASWIDTSGDIVTNQHVVAGATSIKVRFPGRARSRKGDAGRHRSVNGHRRDQVSGDSRCSIR